MNDKQKLFVITIVGVIFSFFSGYVAGIFGQKLSSGSETTELRLRADKLQSELTYRIRETEQFEQQLSDIRSEIDDAIKLSDKSRQYCESITESISDINTTSGNIAELLSELNRNQRNIKQYALELQSENTRLREQLASIQASTNK